MQCSTSFVLRSLLTNNLPQVRMMSSGEDEEPDDGEHYPAILSDHHRLQQQEAQHQQSENHGQQPQPSPPSQQQQQPQSNLLGRRRRARQNWTPPSEVQSARRALFVDKNNIDPEANLNVVRRELDNLIENDCIKWNFDFVKGCPLSDESNKARYAWKPISPVMPSKRQYQNQPQQQQNQNHQHHNHHRNEETANPQEQLQSQQTVQNGSSNKRVICGLFSLKKDTSSKKEVDGNENKVQMESHLMNENCDLKTKVKNGNKRQKTITEYFSKVKKHKSNGATKDDGLEDGSSERMTSTTTTMKTTNA